MKELYDDDIICKIYISLCYFLKGPKLTVSVRVWEKERDRDRDRETKDMDTDWRDEGVLMV